MDMIGLQSKFTVSSTNHFTISSDFIRLFAVILIMVVVYFLSSQILRNLAKLTQYIGLKLGTYSTNKDYELQRYVYQHPHSLVSKFYVFINELLPV